MSRACKINVDGAGSWCSFCKIDWDTNGAELPRCPDGGDLRARIAEFDRRMELIAHGERLWGPQWQSPMSRALGVHVVTVGRWKRGKLGVSERTLMALRGLQDARSGPGATVGAPDPESTSGGRE